MTNWKRALRTAEIFFLLCAGAFLLTGAYLGYASRHVPSKVQDTIENVNRATYAIGSETATEEKLLQMQTRNMTTLFASARRTVDALHDEAVSLRAATDAATRLVNATSDSLNYAALPLVASDLAKFGKIEDNANAQLTTLHATLASVNASARALSQAMIVAPQIAQHLNATTANLDDTTHQGDVIAKHYARLVTRPTTFVRAAAMHIAHWFAVFLGSAL